MCYYNNIKNKVYRTITLSLVLYRCQTLFPNLGVTHRLRVFKKRMLRKKFGHKSKAVTGRCKKLRELYLSPDIVKVIKERWMRWWIIQH